MLSPHLSHLLVASRRRRLAVALTLTGALAGTASADASTVRRDGNTVFFTAGPRETNTVRVSEQTGDLVISDTTISRSRLQAGPGCRMVQTNIASCGFNVAVADVRTLERDDVVFGDSGVIMLVDAGEGDDTFHGGRAPRASRTRWVGGPGLDTIDFASASSRVVVSKDGVGNDGRAGDADDVSLDVERVLGSRFGDILRGSDAPLEVWQGNAGDDKLVGGGGSDRFLERDAGNGADTISGGGVADVDVDGEDVLDYGFNSNRSVGVEITVDSGANDGAPGEGDNVLGVETFDLTRFADRFTGTSARQAVFARGGNDFLDGLGGSDFLECDDGRDTAIVYPGDVRDGCESVGRLRLRTHVEGRDVRLAVAWRHPVAQRELRRIVVRVGRAGSDVLRPGRGSGKTFRGVAHVRVPRGVTGPLPVTVVAVDREGNRQVERRAGAVEVSR